MNKFLIFPLTLALVSCGGNDEAASGTNDEAASGIFDDGNVRIATGAKAPKNLPMGIKPYPGAEIKSSVITTEKSSGGLGVKVDFKSSDDMDEVVAFYKNQMKDKGIKTINEFKDDGVQTITGERGAGEVINIVVAEDGDGDVDVTLVVEGKNE